MGIAMNPSPVRFAWKFSAIFGLLLASTHSLALPSFARQTGLECVACHLSWLELSTVGRQFKLGGYTLIKPVTSGERPLVSLDKDGNPPVLPLAAFVQVSATHTANTNSAGTDSSTFPRQNEVVLQQASLFLAGRIAEHLGVFSQWTYDGVAHHSSIDNFDLRAANRYAGSGLDVQYGMSLNNSPTMSDIYNSTPVWGFPFSGSPVAAAAPPATLIEGGLAQQVAGLTAYSMWNRTFYAELGGYRTADKSFSFLRTGIDRSTAAVLQGTAPYWRLALQHDWDEGTHSAMVGTYGLKTKKYPDPTSPSGLTDGFRDIGVDAQYQYITDAHRVGAQLNYIRETQSLDGTFASEGSSNARLKLSTLNSKVTYYYMAKYGVTLGYQRVRGDSDDALYNTGEPVAGSANGSPNASSYIIELNWLPWRDRRFTLQYTGFRKFNGAKTNYDGFGRNAKDNNTLYLLAWFPF
jgi:hypothetical protein